MRKKETQAEKIEGRSLPCNRAGNLRERERKGAQNTETQKRKTDDWAPKEKQAGEAPKLQSKKNARVQKTIPEAPAPAGTSTGGKKPGKNKRSASSRE